MRLLFVLLCAFAAIGASPAPAEVQLESDTFRFLNIESYGGVLSIDTTATARNASGATLLIASWDRDPNAPAVALVTVEVDCDAGTVAMPRIREMDADGKQVGENNLHLGAMRPKPDNVWSKFRYLACEGWATLDDTPAVVGRAAALSYAQQWFRDHPAP